MISTSSNDLHRLFYNIKLFQIGKQSPPGVLYVGNDMMEMSINDGHTFLMDRAEHSGGTDDYTVLIDSAVVKDVELEMRDYDGQVGLHYDGTHLFVGSVPYVVEKTDVAVDELGIMQHVFHHQPPPSQAFALNPDRFRKLSLIKPGDYPMDFYRVWHSRLQRYLTLWKAGPSCSGALVELDRDILVEGAGYQNFLW